MIRKFLTEIFKYINDFCIYFSEKTFLQILFFLITSCFLFGFYGITLVTILIIFFSIAAYYLLPFGAISLSVIIPIKFLLKSSLFNSQDGAMTFLIPLILVFSFLNILKEKIEYKADPVDVFLFLIFFASIISSVANICLYGFRPVIFLDFFIWLQLVGFYLIGKFYLSKPLVFPKFIKFNLYVVNFVSILALIDIFISKIDYQPWIESYEKIAFRASGTLGNPNALAGYLMIFLLLFISTKNISFNKKILSQLTLIVIPFITLILTFSRGALIVFLAMGILYCLKEHLYRYLLIALILLLSAFILSPQAYRDRFTNLFSGQHISFSEDSGRIWSFKNVLYINKNHSLFGNGWGSYGGEYAYSTNSPTYLEGVQGGIVTVGNTDDQWLQIYAQQGVVGVALYICLLAYLIKYYRKNNLFIPIMGYFSLGIFIDIFQFYQISFWGWLLLGIISSCESSEKC